MAYDQIQKELSVFPTSQHHRYNQNSAIPGNGKSNEKVYFKPSSHDQTIARLEPKTYLFERAHTENIQLHQNTLCSATIHQN